MSDKVSDKPSGRVAEKVTDPAAATPIPRRSFLLGAGTAVAAGLAPAANAQTPPAVAAAATLVVEPEPLLTLTPTEHAFMVAAADTLIPADELWPSGGDCGVPRRIDRQRA